MDVWRKEIDVSRERALEDLSNRMPFNLMREEGLLSDADIDKFAEAAAKSGSLGLQDAITKASIGQKYVDNFEVVLADTETYS
jgi:hypothetical protein